MADWTTKQLSDDIEIDLHPDLDSFPMIVRQKSTGDVILLNKKEVHELKELLVEYESA